MNVRAVDPARSRIVLFGTPAYVDPRLPDVPVVANNIADLAAVLTDPDLGGFDPAYCVIVPTGAGVREVGQLLVQAAMEAEDLLLFYYSGHGLLGTRRHDLYLCVADTRPDQLAFTALGFDAVRDACLDSRAENLVVILDSCYSGKAIGEALADDEVLGQLEVAGTYTLTSASATRTALMLPGELHTAFTERLLHLLHTGLPGAGALLSLRDIYQHLNRQLRSEGLPAPQCRGIETAEMLGLSRNPIYIPTAAEAAAIREAAASRAAVLPESPRAGSPVDRLRQRAAAALTAAERNAQTIPEESRKALALAGVTQALASTDPDRAERIAQTITDGYQKAQALAGIAQVLASTDPDRAERTAQTITDGYQKALALAGIAKAQASTDPERTERLWGEAERTAQAIKHEQQKAQTLARIVMALSPVSPDRAERIAQIITDASLKAQALANIAQVLAVTDPDRAERTAQSITHGHQKALALAGIAQALAGTNPDRAIQLATEAERIAGSITNELSRESALAGIAQALAGTNPDRAERIAGSITDESLKAQALVGIARVWLGEG